MSFVTDIVERVRALLFRGREERELDEELRFHIEMETEKNVRAGMPRAEARRRALLAFGGVEGFKERVRDARGVRPLEDFGADLRYAWRKLRQAPGFAAVTIATLALGIGASSVIFSVAYGVLMRSLPYESPERLVRVFESDEPGDLSSLSPPNFMSVREQSRAFTEVAVYDYEAVTLTGRGEARWLEGAEVSAGFFEVMGTRPILGRTFAEGENLPGNDGVAVLGYALWQELVGGDPEIIGRTLTLHGRSRTVVGVMPAGFDFPYGATDIWIPLDYSEQYSATSASGRGSNWLTGVARLREGVGFDRARAELTMLAKRLEERFPVGNEDVRFVLSPLRDVLVSSARTPLMLLLGAVALLLLIACANVAGLLLARAASRREELAARVAIGAGRGRLIRQLITESLLIALLGGALGLLLAMWGTQMVVAAGPAGLPRMDAIRIDGALVSFGVAVTLLATLLAGLMPALHATRIAPASVLREGGRSGAAARIGSRMRAGLVIAELALAVVLLTGAGLLLRSFVEMVSKEPGFRTEDALVFQVRLPETQYDEDAEIRSYYERLLERLRAVPGVETTGAIFRLPIIYDPFNAGLTFEDGAPAEAGQEASIEYSSITPGYLETMGIPIRRGRGIGDRDGEEAPGVVVINETAARRFFPGEDPIGRRISLGGPFLTIVGVVGDVPQWRATQIPEPEALMAFAQTPFGRMHVVVRAGTDPLALVPMIRRAMREVDPDIPGLNFRTLERIVADSFGRERFLSSLLGLFASAALLLAAIGIFGLLSFTVAERTPEIGIRVALGATRGEVVGMVLRHTLKLAAAGLGIGIAGAVLATRVLAGMLYGVSALDPATYAAVVALIALTAVAAGLLPARRAAAVDPMIALRRD